MTNKHLTVPPSEVALARLKVLTESINDMYHSGNMVLESDIVSSFHEALNLFYDSLDGSIVGSVMKVYAGAPADPSVYNVFTTAMFKDASAIFSEIGALDRLVSSSFNSIISEREQAIQTSKKVSNKLGDYLLYADSTLGAGFFFGDSFTSPDRIDVGSSLVDTDECFLSTEEGVVLLPLDGEPDRPSVGTILINKNSNGEQGNNHQLGVFGHEDIEVISDNEPNTWFEYEKVTSSESNSPLVLDLTFVLDEAAIVNHININPINFGTATPIKIVKIEISTDGSDYSSIKDEVPIRDFSSEEEKEEFDLSPATSKFSGQGFYSFLPRRVQYVHIVMEQHDPYTIETNNGLRLRYAIGIRDINILGRKFLLEGSLISNSFDASDTIRKVSLWASENPIEESALADLNHSISYNDGASWLALQPQQRTGTEVSEILNFNNIADDSIATEEDVTSLRHKISMKRNKDAFKGNVTIKEERLNKMDVVSTPAGGQFDISLTERPIKKSINMMFPFMGSFSCPRDRNGSSVRGQSPLMDLDFVEFSIGSSGERIRESDSKKEGTVRFKLPFVNIPNLEERIRVFVNGEQIEYCPKTSEGFASTGPTSYNSGIDSDSKVYFLNKKGTELQFGHTETNGTQRGYLPSGGSVVKVCLDGDNPFLRLTDRGYILNLSAPSDGQKESVSITALNNLGDNEATPHQFEIPPGSEVFSSHPNFTAVSSKDLTDEEKSSVDSAFKFDAKNAQQTVLGKVNPSIASTGVNPVGKLPSKKALSFMTKNASDIATSTLNIEADHENQDRFTSEDGGMFPPVYAEGVQGPLYTDHFDIVEYELDGTLITGSSRQFTNKVPFKNGDSELRDLNWNKQASYYTFDYNTGTVYLGSPPAADRRTTIVCKRRNIKVIDPMFWKFDKNQVTGKINTQKIVLDPRVVFTMKRSEEMTYSVNVRKHSLISTNDLGHDWNNSSIVRGTVKPDVSLFAANSKPIEIKFIDGESEFSNNVEIKDENITFTNTVGTTYTFQLSKIDLSNNKTLIGTPVFAPVRELTSATAPVNQFDLIPTATPTNNGEWNVDSNGLVTVVLDSTPGEYIVSYKLNNADPGIDINGMYSVDYTNGTIHFGSPPPATGNIQFEVSMYSAFYNIAKQISLGDVEEVNEDNKTITFNSAFGLKFLKQELADKSRPQVIKVFYDYYKRDTASLEDLEPYFSPICKDIAFRAVTSNILEEL